MAQHIGDKFVIVGIALSCMLNLYVFGQTLLPKISQKEGQSLVHEAIKRHAAKAFLEPMNDRYGDDFLAFAAESPEGTPGSPIIGYFAVNAYTGDVWEIAGDVCTIRSSTELNTLQKRILKRLGEDQKVLVQLHTKKPSVCN